MKYLKTYEDSITELKYKVGDYVILNLESLKDEYELTLIEYPTNKITKIYKICIDNFFHFPYIILLNENDEDNIFYLRKTDILRKATPQEIEQFEIEKSANKYNL